MEESRAPMRALARELIETVLLALAIFLLLDLSVQNFRVEGPSMMPTLENNQYLLVNKLVYLRLDRDALPFLGDDSEKGELFAFHPPRRGEVVIFRYVEIEDCAPDLRGCTGSWDLASRLRLIEHGAARAREPVRDFVKRVAAVPGDVLEVRDRVLHVNGERLDNAPVRSSQEVNIPAVVPPDSYFVMGDNRGSSLDSRDWGLVPSELLIGRGWVSYWPLDRWNVLRLSPRG